MSRIKALIFDQDGVIIDSERDGHRVAFNRAFKDFGYNIEWDIDTYYELLQITGGKERLLHYFHTQGFGKKIEPGKEYELIKNLHKRKTEIFIALLESGKIPLRSGIKRIMKEAMDKKLKLGIITASNERVACTIAYKMLKDIKFDFLFAGDIVSKKKPNPEIYLLVLNKTKIKPEEIIIFDDSRNGVFTAKDLGLNVVAITNAYTERENFSEADIVITSLGDPVGEKGELKQSKKPIEYEGVLYLDQLLEYFSSTH